MYQYRQFPGIFVVDRFFFHARQPDRRLAEKEEGGLVHVYHPSEVPIDIIQLAASFMPGEIGKAEDMVRMLLQVGHSGPDSPELPHDHMVTLEVPVVTNEMGETVEVSVVSEEGTGHD